MRELDIEQRTERYHRREKRREEHEDTDTGQSKTENKQEFKSREQSEPGKVQFLPEVHSPFPHLHFSSSLRGGAPRTHAPRKHHYPLYDVTVMLQ
jgi:hypothetical protein